MVALERMQRRMAGESVDRLPTQPLFMVYAADLIGVTYADYVQDHRILVEAQLALCDKYPLDVASCCSDAWREAADCGTELVYEEHGPPHGKAPVLQCPADLPRLAMPDPAAGGRMTDRLRAVEHFAAQVKGRLVILGWVEGPLAEAADLHGMTPTMLATRKNLPFIRDLLDWTTELAMRFARVQVAAGADMIGIGDAAASLVSPAFYRDEVMPRQRQIVDAIHAAGGRARLHICGDVHGKFAEMAATGADVIDIDFPQSLADVRAAVGPETCLAGNVHPVNVLRRGTPDQVHAAFCEAHAAAGGQYVLAAGCEIPPGTPDENLAAMFAYAGHHT